MRINPGDIHKVAGFCGRLGDGSKMVRMSECFQDRKKTTKEIITGRPQDVFKTFKSTATSGD
jgi:hypothetical protein